MYCSNCGKDVDINSVASNKIHGGITYDLPHSDIEPTIVSGSSKIINVCKSCGESAYLFQSKYAYDAAVSQKKQKEEYLKELREAFTKNPLYSIGLGLVCFLVYCLGIFLEGSFWFYEWDWFGAGLLGFAIKVGVVALFFVSLLCLPLMVISTVTFLINAPSNRSQKRKKQNFKQIRYENSSGNYYYHDAVNNQVKGPLAKEDLGVLETRNEIDELTQVCKEGSSDWITYKEIK